MSQDIRHFTVHEDDDGQRLDRWLKKNLPKTPYALLQKMVRTGQVRIDGKRAKTDTRLSMGQSIRIPPAEEKSEKISFIPQDGDKEFLQSISLYDDGHILILNKPYGLPVQGGPNIRRHVDGMLATLRNLKGVSPRLVHRLDRDTSGILVCGRSLSITAGLGELFAGRDIKKIYWAVVSPAPKEDKGDIEGALIKGEGAKKDMMVIDNEAGKPSRTSYRVIQRSKEGDAAFVAFWPRTGRMHQIRVHAADGLGCPIIGDEKYGGLGDILNHYNLPGRLHLHAARLIFRHPKTSELMDIKAALPDDLRPTFETFGFDAAYDGDPFLEPKDKKNKSKQMDGQDKE